MTLEKFTEMFFGNPGSSMPPTIVIFTSEDDAENWIDDKYNGGDNRSAEIVGVLHSEYKMKKTFRPEWCAAKVYCFYCPAPEVVAVVVDLEEKQK